MRRALKSASSPAAPCPSPQPPSSAPLSLWVSGGRSSHSDRTDGLKTASQRVSGALRSGVLAEPEPFEVVAVAPKAVAEAKGATWTLERTGILNLGPEDGAPEQLLPTVDIQSRAFRRAVRRCSRAEQVVKSHDAVHSAEVSGSLLGTSRQRMCGPQPP